MLVQLTIWFRSVDDTFILFCSKGIAVQFYCYVNTDTRTINLLLNLDRLKQEC